MKKTLLLFGLILGLAAFISVKPAPDPCVRYTLDLQKQDFQLYWKDDKGQILGSLENLKNWLQRKGKKLLFATNAGMYKVDRSAQGLFIQDGKTVAALDSFSGSGNFYLKPNGVFYTTRDKKAFICKTEDFVPPANIQYATQSGPMLLVDGQIHPAFRKGSINRNIRNGVGILPGQRVVFALSKEEINLYDFASYFQKMGCQNALYLDGFVSRAYCPDENWIQTDGDFGVMIGIIEK